jgi:hypothetical protein
MPGIRETPMLALLILACSNKITVVADDTAGAVLEDTAPPGPEVDYTGATLVITSPRSGDFLPLGEAATFSAEVRSPAGEPLPFEEIVWTTDVTPTWTLTGARAEDATLPVGTHALTATATLPNGDRVGFGVGGILVQSAYAGIYVGTLSVEGTAEYNGTPIVTACSGALTLVVDAEGETAVGDSSCPLNLFGFEVDTSYVFDLENDEGDLAGETEVQVYGFGAVSFDVEGEVTEDGALSGAFAGDVYGFLAVEGDFAIERVTRDVSGR